MARRSQGAGWIYAITNPAWAGYVKLGRTFDVAERLRGYQTSSPHRDYHLHFAREFPDVLAAERHLKILLPGFRAQGEWHLMHPDDARFFIERL